MKSLIDVKNELEILKMLIIDSDENLQVHGYLTNFINISENKKNKFETHEELLNYIYMRDSAYKMKMIEYYEKY